MDVIRQQVAFAGDANGDEEDDRSWEDKINDAIRAAEGEFGDWVRDITGISNWNPFDDIDGITPIAEDTFLSDAAGSGNMTPEDIYRQMAAELEEKLHQGAEAGGEMGIAAAGVGVGTVARSGDDIIEGIYEFTGKSGRPYVGQSGRLPGRLGDHTRSGKLPPGAKVEVTEVLGGKTAREIAEQRRVDELGGVGNLENERNPFGARRRRELMGEGN